MGWFWNSGPTTPKVNHEEMLHTSFIHAPVGDPDRGELIFSHTCARCHTPIKGGAAHRGPNLHGLFGGVAGARLPDYDYTEAMRKKAVVWQDETLYVFLADPSRYVQGTKMEFAGLCTPKDRTDVLAYLKLATLTGDGTTDVRHHRYKANYQGFKPYGDGTGNQLPPNLTPCKPEQKA
eukprot:TRINITY_DN33169_c0_g1_i1.p1 TRINITY_DN33169_c0_g1~~TRINITY_DN33169_c0_g1_i1.p1  ORF type:complete len:178 (+),score=26.20 TRINITY_DN33169_c0_g1_i1:129-662(+)